MRRLPPVCEWLFLEWPLVGFLLPSEGTDALRFRGREPLFPEDLPEGFLEVFFEGFAEDTRAFSGPVCPSFELETIKESRPPAGRGFPVSCAR